MDVVAGDLAPLFKLWFGGQDEGMQNLVKGQGQGRDQGHN